MTHFGLNWTFAEKPPKEENYFKSQVSRASSKTQM